MFFLVLLPCSYYYFDAQKNRHAGITSFDDCVSAGYLVVPTYPETCKIPGRVFVNDRQKNVATSTASRASAYVATSTQEHSNLSYFIEGEKIQLQDGVGRIPGSVALKRATSTVFASRSTANFDINADSVLDKLLLISTRQTLQGPVEYYLAAALSLNDGYAGSNALPIGTDIASTTIAYGDGVIVVVYHDTSLSQTTSKVRYYTLVNNLLEETSKPRTSTTQQ